MSYSCLFFLCYGFISFCFLFWALASFVSLCLFCFCPFPILPLRRLSFLVLHVQFSVCFSPLSIFSFFSLLLFFFTSFVLRLCVRSFLLFLMTRRLHIPKRFPTPTLFLHIFRAFVYLLCYFSCFLLRSLPPVVVHP